MVIKNSLIIPCFNESQNIQARRADLLKLPELLEGEVILVDNGSSDDTRAVISSLAAENPGIVLVVVENNIGYGFGIVSGLKASRGTYVGWTHADGQMNLRDAVTGFSMLWNKEEPERFFVMGRRRGRTVYDRFFEIGMSFVESVLFGTILTDITAQPKVMSRLFFESWETPPNDFSLDLYAYLLAKKSGREVFKFDTEYGTRVHGVSSWNSGLMSRLKLIRRTIEYSFQLRREFGKRS